MRKHGNSGVVKAKFRTNLVRPSLFTRVPSRGLQSPDTCGALAVAACQGDRRACACDAVPQQHLMLKQP